MGKGTRPVQAVDQELYIILAVFPSSMFECTRQIEATPPHREGLKLASKALVQR
jgi:hypothetical protein